MFLTAITFFLILSILVFVHELGHYMVARFVGVRVEEFGFGLPPRIFGKKIKGTIYSINWLPIGGFVKLAGEDADEEDIRESKIKKAHVKEYFWAKNKRERAAILCAGVIMNFLLAVGITSFLLVRGVIEPTDVVRVEKVVAASPAEAIGLKENDVIRSISVKEDGVEKKVDIKAPDSMINLVKTHAGETVVLFIERNGSPLMLSVIPRKNPPQGEGALGVAITNLEKHTYTWYQAPIKSVQINGTRMWQMLTSMGDLLFRLVTGKKVDSGEVAGPVGIAKVTGEAVKYGLDAVLEFASILSLNLALLNILPFPALDGGRLAFVVFEKMGRKARPQLERTIHQFGMLFLLLLLALITINDVLHLAK